MTAIGEAPAARPAKRREEGFWYPYILIAPTMITLTIVGLIPFLFTVLLSVLELKFGQVKGFAGFDNYTELLGDPRFWESLKVTFLFVIIAVPIEFMLGMIGALALSQRIYLRSVLIPFLFIPTIMAPIVVGLLWKIMLAGSWGFLSYNILEQLDILAGTSVFASPNLALYGIVLVDVWQWTPFMMLAFFAGLQAMPVNPYKAAAVDGATPIQIFFKITLPMMAPLLAVIGLLRLIDAFKIFDSIFLLTSGGPGTSTESISMLAYKTTFEFWRIGEASALAVVIWILFFLFCNVFYQVAKKKLKVF